MANRRPRTDLYSLGLVIYECLCGRGPFDNDDGQLQTANAIIRAHLKVEPLPPSKVTSNVPEELERLVMAMLEKDPTRRPPNATLVAMRLREIKARIDAASAGGDGNKTDPTPLDNRMLQFSADTDRGGAREPLAAAGSSERGPNRPTNGDAGGPQHRAATVTLRMSVPVAEPPTATSEPVDRTAPTPSAEPVPAAPRPTHGTQRISGRAVEAEADERPAIPADDHDREWRIASERALVPPTAGTTSGVVGADVPGVPRRRRLLPAAAASVGAAAILCAVAALTVRHGAASSPTNTIASSPGRSPAPLIQPTTTATTVEVPPVATVPEPPWPAATIEPGAPKPSRAAMIAAPPTPKLSDVTPPRSAASSSPWRGPPRKATSGVDELKTTFQ